MKIGILTQPLQTNYGGLLQAYALQTVLKRMGYKAWTINRPYKKVSLLRRIFSYLKRMIFSAFKTKSYIIRVWPTDKESKLIAQNTNRFIKENIQVTEPIYSLNNFSSLKKYEFDAYIVGSDQVWRPSYSPNISNYFLDFLTEKDKVKRIAYAASFGVDNWEFNDIQTSLCAALAKKFDAISVREDSAKDLCKDYFGVKAELVLDPTMLCTKDDYIELIKKDSTPASKGTLMTYILDRSHEKEEIISKVAKEFDLLPFSTLPQSKYAEVGAKNIKHCIFPPVTEWLRGFLDASYVVTDSFHGTVFSIIFNKPFITIGNSERGITRFTSLLNMFGLEDRLISFPSELTKELMHKNIDYIRIEELLKNKRTSSLNFLSKVLKNNYE
ncbi:polysaccharide pyruvyl transferase family protein [Bacteroides sedimenti]|uniref:MurB family protein n=1 Tax=Bacteroides sedimenti TaxID=2136147 RepID=A0ABN6Z1C7_9BACE